MKRNLIKLFVASFLLMLTTVCNATAYTWTGTSGVYEFPNDILKQSGSVSYTFTSKAGSEFYLEYHRSGFSVTIYLDGKLQYVGSQFYKSFTDNASHTITLDVSGTPSQWTPSQVEVSRAVIKHPIENQNVVKSISLEEAGDLQYYLPASEKYYVKKLTITGPLNGKDMSVIRDLAGLKIGSLSVLNMSGVQMKSGGGSCGTHYHEWSADNGETRSTYTADDVINDGLFCGLLNLVEITLPKSITEIRYKAFENCSNLEKVTIGNSATVIGDDTFAGCSSLTTLTLPEGTKSIGKYAFCGCSSLTTVSFPSSITSVSDEAFLGCTAISRVSIASLNSWCAINFSDASANPTYYSKKIYLGSSYSPITSLSIPDGVLSIGSYCFANCTGITSVDIPGSVTSIGNGAFSNCTGLYMLSIPEGVNQIGYNSFEGCSNIQSVAFPTTLTRVAQCAFDGCSSIKKVSTPSIAAWCSIDFSYNDVWESLLDPSGNVTYAYDSEDGRYEIGQPVRYYKSNPLFYSKNLYVNEELVKTLIIPEGVTSIGSGAFAHCTSIASVSIPKSVTSINEMAFYRCSNISTVTINDISSWNNISFKGSGIYHNILGEKYSWGDYYDYDQTYIYNYSSNPVYASCTSTVPDVTKVQWSSTVPSVAQVDIKGAITAHSSGNTMIIATTGDNRAFCVLEVNGDKTLVQSVTLSEKSLKINRGEIHTLTATVLPETATDKTITWTSNDENVAIVANGLVTAVEAGSTTITAKTNDGSNLTAICEVTVTSDDEDNPDDDPVNPDEPLPDNVIYADNTDVQSGGQMVLPVKMKSTEAITGYQFDLVLPDGFSVAEEDGDYLIDLASRTTYKKHSISYQDQADGSIRIVCTSLNNATFAELDGVVTNITLNVDESVEAGDYNIIYKNIELATPALNKYKVAKWSSKVTVFDYILGDVNNDKDVSVVDAAATVNLILGVNTAGLNRKAADIDADGEISVTDAAGVVNIILGQGASVKSAPAKTRLTATADNTLTLSDFTAEAGTQQTISVGMNNTASITGIQFDLVLPEGVTVAQEDGDYLIDISTDRTTYKNHSASYQMQADGSMRVVCTSLSNKTFKENSGNVIDITLDIASSISGGSHTITLKNIELATPELKKYKPSAVSATMTVSGGAYNYIAVDNGGNNVNKSVASGDDVTINDTYQSLSVTEDIDNVNVSYSRTYKNTNWQAWYVPFEMTYTSGVEQSFSFGKFAGTYTDDDGNFYITIIRLKPGDFIKANTSYFVKAKTANTTSPQVITVNGTNLKTTTSSSFLMHSAEKEIKVTGLYNRKTATTDDMNWYYFSGGQYCLPNVGTTLGAFRFHLTINDREDNPYGTLPNPVTVKIMEIDEMDDVTGIESQSLLIQDGIAYDLSGRMVTNPRHGVYIINGKKIFIQ